MDAKTKQSLKTWEMSTTSAIDPEVLNKSLTSAQNKVHNALIENVLGQAVDSPSLPNIIEELARLSRNSEELRNRLARESVLRKLLENLRVNGSISSFKTTSATLRCIGNTCIENLDACRTVANHGFAWAPPLLQAQTAQGAEIQGLTIKTLYNLCSQSDAAQIQCYHDGIHQSIIQALAATGDSSTETAPIAEQNLSVAIDVLFSITSHYNDLGKGTTLPNDIERRLLQCPRQLVDKLETDDHASLLEAVLTFLRSSAIQTQVVENSDVVLVWGILSDNERKTHMLAEDDADDRKMLTALSTSFIWILSDLAAHPSFAAAESQDYMLTNGLVELLDNNARPRESRGVNGHVYAQVQSETLSTAACQILGNLVHALPADAQSTFVQTHNLHSSLLAAMVISNDAEFLHSAAGLLMQLSRPSVEVREVIAGDANALPALNNLSNHPNPQLKPIALSLTRALGRDSPVVQELLKPLAGKVMAGVAEAQKTANEASGVPAIQQASGNLS